MDKEAEFNRTAAREFAKEYEEESGHGLRFKALGNPFPDAILETPEGVELGVEFVSVVLPFVWQEEAYFKKYRERFSEILQPARPRYQSVAIRLQPSSSILQGPRPYKLPNVNGAEGKRLVLEFHDLLAVHFDRLREAQGILIQWIAADATQAFPTLLKYFDAIMVWDIDKSDPRKPHPCDPIIESPVIIYGGDELSNAVHRSLTTKARKGNAYATNILVLHTLQTPGKLHFPGVAMNAGQIEALGRELLTKEHELFQRFEEIWFLNVYWTEDRHRLYRLR